MRKAVVDSSGLVVNIIAIALDDDGRHSHWRCPEGCTLKPDGSEEADSVAQTGGTWNGTIFIAPVVPETPRIEVLMNAGPATQVLNEETDTMVDRPAEDIAADKTELLGLLRAKLAASEDLTWNEMNKMLALERES
jgi:hypothetical protein